MKNKQLELDLYPEQNLIKQCPRCGQKVFKDKLTKNNHLVIIDYECTDFNCMWKSRQQIIYN